jgi:hypothetical protein
MVGQVMSERNASLLFSGKLHSGHCEAVVSVEGKETLSVFDRYLCLYKIYFAQTFPVVGDTA